MLCFVFAIDNFHREIKTGKSKTDIWIGVNAVTRALERGECGFAIIARDAPSALVQHLPLLAFVRGTSR